MSSRFIPTRARPSSTRRRSRRPARQEDHHRGEAEEPDLRQHDGPGEEKGDLEIEQDEQDRDEVIAHVELHPRVLERLEAALVRRQLLGVGAIRRDERADGEEDRPDDDAEENEQQNGEILVQHGHRPARTVILVVRGRRSSATGVHGDLPARRRSRATLAARQLRGGASTAEQCAVIRAPPGAGPSGADGETRTPTAFATAPSRQRVYQFHHVGPSTVTCPLPTSEPRPTSTLPARGNAGALAGSAAGAAPLAHRRRGTAAALPAPPARRRSSAPSVP